MIQVLKRNHDIVFTNFLKEELNYIKNIYINIITLTIKTYLAR